MSDRSTAPVFVIGCPRSGTTLLYHMLLSAGQFAIYRAETHVFNTLAPRCGDLRVRANREQLLEIWLGSRMHVQSKLEASDVRTRVDDFHDAGSFLSMVMEMVMAAQGAVRWAETTPVHVLQMPEILTSIPNALFIHVIRDGRDVAMSLDQLGWVSSLPWDKGNGMYAAAASWAWIVRNGRADGDRLGASYLEVRYEALVESPRDVLRTVGAFVAQELDYDHIQANAIGSVAKPNTSFPGQPAKFSGRWREAWSGEQVATVEAMVGRQLKELGYQTTTSGSASGAWRRMAYDARFNARQWLKLNSSAGRRVDLSLFDPKEAQVPAR